MEATITLTKSQKSKIKKYSGMYNPIFNEGAVAEIRRKGNSTKIKRFIWLKLFAYRTKFNTKSFSDDLKNVKNGFPFFFGCIPSTLMYANQYISYKKVRYKKYS